MNKAQRIIRMHQDIRAMRAHMVRMSAKHSINGPTMRMLIALHEMRIQKLRALLG